MPLAKNAENATLVKLTIKMFHSGQDDGKFGASLPQTSTVNAQLYLE